MIFDFINYQFDTISNTIFDNRKIQTFTFQDNDQIILGFDDG